MRWLGGNLDRRIAAAIVEVSIKSQRAEPGVPQLSTLESGVLDDRHEAGAKEPETLARGDRRREGRPFGREIARRGIEPCGKVRRDVGVASGSDRAMLAAKAAEAGTG